MSDSLDVASSAGNSRQRSSQLWSEISASASTQARHNAPLVPSTVISGLEELVDVLKSSGLPGPAVIIGPKEYIGHGSQFMVHKAEMMTRIGPGFQSVASKQPRFDADDNSRLDLSDPKAQQHLQSIKTEIKALTNPIIRRHPNIVQLLSWGFDPYSVHLPPILAVELALSDLEKLLKDEGDSLSFGARYSYCVDIAEGLDIIHECCMVHGDLKPANILIFAGQDRLVAKLADFGLSFDDSEATSSSLALNGTVGWRAPEVVDGKRLTLEEAQKADNYSLGLVAGETLFDSAGRQPQLSEDQRKQWIEDQMMKFEDTADIEDQLKSSLISTLQHLLQDEPSNRVLRVARLFPESRRLQKSDQGAPLNEPGMEIRPIQSVQVLSKSEPCGFFWEIPGPPDEFIRHMLPHMMESPSSTSAKKLFDYFLDATAEDCMPGPPYIPPFPLLDVVEAAARGGSQAARAMIFHALEFYQEAEHEKHDSSIMAHLNTAVGAGAILAAHRLRELDPKRLSELVQLFKTQGGYCQFYYGNFLPLGLHSIAAFGTARQLQDFCKGSDAIDVNAKKDGVTALYLACMRGSWEMARELLARGAHAAGTYTDAHITCLHWMISFEPSDQSEAVSKLLQAGADVNAMAQHPIPFPHYPFELPAGTPLHWAAITESHSVVRELVTHRADLSIRDGSDPYRIDHRVRVLEPQGPYDQDAYSIGTGTLGLSPLDYAAMNHDPFIFDFMLSFTEAPVDVNEVDEEGFGLLHRLSTSPIRWTRLGSRFSASVYKGSPSHFENRMTRTVAALKSLAVDLNRVTKLRNPNVNTVGNCTPLMLAALSGQHQLVKALLEAGADARATNEMGMTALHCVPEDVRAVPQVVELLLRHGANPQSTSSASITPLQKVATTRSLEAMDLLLSNGADIEEVDNIGPHVFLGSSILARLAYKRYDDLHCLGEDFDATLAKLLEKWLADKEKRERVVMKSGPTKSLLHWFSAAFMPRVVGVLLRCGAQVNALHTDRRFENGAWVKLQHQRTPLDEVIEDKDFHERNQMKYRTPYQTGPDFDRLSDRAAAVIKLLKDAGGVRSPRPQSKPGT